MYNFVVEFGTKKAFLIVWFFVFFVITTLNALVKFIFNYNTEFGYMLISSIAISLLFAGFIPLFIANTKEKISAQKRAKEILAYDVTTGFLNKTFFITTLKREISYAKRYGNDFSLMLVRILNHNDIIFKHGRNTMDYVLNQSGIRIKKALRESDIVGKYDTYEFSILLASTGKEGSMVVEDRIKKAIEDEVFFFKDKIGVEVQIATCEFDKEVDEDSDSYLNRLEKKFQ